MRKLFFLIAMLAMSNIFAQTVANGGIKSIIAKDKQLAGCNYVSYFNVYNYLSKQGKTKLTPSPSGYEPFYISTYARHGSRWLTDADTYDVPLTVLKQAETKGLLTQQGKILLKDLQKLRTLCPNSKLGVLTDIGAAQHRDIARRMCKNFPEIFNSEGQFFAQSSSVKRCVLSMNAQAAIVDSVTKGKMPQAYGRKGMQDRLAGHYNNANIDKWRDKGYPYHSKERTELTPYKRICSQVFTDLTFVDVKKLQSFSRCLFSLASNMQSHNYDIKLWKFFTDEEADSLYAVNNRHWYRMFGPSPVTGGLMPLRSKWQLEDIVEGADSIVNRKNWHGANLRFGHDTALMPLICLLELGTSAKQVDESKIGTIDTFFRNQEMFPMAGNIQLIFYRPKSGTGDVLVKALLNECEVTLPGTPVSGPYYKWNEIRKRWLTRIR